MESMSASGKSIDILSLADEVVKQDVVCPVESTWDEQIEEVVIDAVPASWRDYFDAVHDAHRKRDYANTLNASIHRLKNEPDALAEELISFTESLLMDHNAPQKERSLYEIGVGAYDRVSSDSGRGLLYWPVHDMDEAFDPITDEYIVLQADAKCGKTALALQACLTWAESGHRVSYANLEMPDLQFSARILSYLAGVDWRRMIQKRADADEHERIKGALKILKDLPLYACHGSKTIEQLMAWARREVRRGSDLLVIDNTKHILRGTYRKLSRTEFFGEISTAGKLIRESVDRPVLLLHHTNKDGDASWSADFSRDCDKILSMREVTHSRSGDVPPVPEGYEAGKWIRISSPYNRTGTSNWRDLFFDGPVLRFKSKAEMPT
jgi:replicative DNA helicase